MAASIWRGRISFGLVSIPVRLVKAARRERTRFRRVQRVQPTPSAVEEDDEAPSPRVLAFPGASKNSSPVPPSKDDEVQSDEANNQAVERIHNPMVQDALKGFETAKDEFVVLAPEEIAALRPQTSAALEITEFVKLEEIDPLYYEASYYVMPEVGGEKAYGLLFATLKESGHAGMGSLAMHGREHVVLIRAGRDAMVLHSMFYANEVGRPGFQVEQGTANPKELELAKMLVGALEAKFDPDKWKDSYEERLKALIESRMPVASPTATAGAAKAAATTVDIMDALRKSIEMNRKPVAREEAPVKPKRAARRK